MDKRSNKHQIVFIIGSMRRGGAERVLSILANSYAEKGWQVNILTLLDDSNDYDLNKNIKVQPICNLGESRIRQLPKWISNIRSHVVENKPDRIVSFIARINIIAMFSCIGLNQRLIVSERNDPDSDGRSIIVRFASYLLYPLADCIVFQTKWAQSCFSKKIQKNSIIIPNPISVSVKASKTKKRKIVAVGRLSEQKNHAMLINAFKKVHNDYPEYKLYIYGEGKLRITLIKQIQELGLIDNVFLPGNVANIHEEISDAEIFVLSSNYEGLSNALLEAMMMGLPCISTDCAGSNEVIISGNNGILVPIGSVEKLAEAMEQLILDRELANKLGKEAELSSKHLVSYRILKDWEFVIEK
jgi:glycosyltransferase involved in cell wall biosynthesis